MQSFKLIRLRVVRKAGIPIETWHLFTNLEFSQCLCFACLYRCWRRRVWTVMWMLTRYSKKLRRPMTWQPMTWTKQLECYYTHLMKTTPAPPTQDREALTMNTWVVFWCRRWKTTIVTPRRMTSIIKASARALLSQVMMKWYLSPLYDPSVPAWSSFSDAVSSDL